MTLKVKNVPNKRWWDFWIALFLLSAITMVAARLWVTDWTEDLYILVYLTFFAGLSGLALGASRFSPLISALFSMIYGIFTIGWLFGTTVEMPLSWRERLLNFLGWRLRTAISQFNAGETVTDPILFLTIMALILWILGSAAAFILIRQGTIWPSILPLGLFLLIIGHYDQNLPLNTRYLMTFLFLALLIIGRMTFIRSKQKWKRVGIQTTTETYNNLAKTLFILASTLVLLSWLIPLTPRQVTRYSALWETLTEPWDRLTENLSDLFVFDRGTSPLSTGYFGESMGLGTGSPSSEAVVMRVKVTSNPPAGSHPYWRARSYDRYRNSSWATSADVSEMFLSPDTFDIPYPEWQSGERAAYTFTVEMDNPLNVYATGAPVWVSRPVEATTQVISNAEADLIAMMAEPEFAVGESYQVETQVNLPTISQLRQTRTDYPDWLARYLQLPSDFSPAVRDLAAEITADADNPYDQANQITRYLRENINYSRIIQPPPPDVDPLEWFLFDAQTGFCNYYATAEVLMLRSLGIPARLSVGYAAGDYDRETQTYTVQKRDSHAWPEVYFVDFGWIIFEPTTLQPAVTLPLGGQTGDENEPLTQELWEFPLMDPPIPTPEGTPESTPDLTENESAAKNGTSSEKSSPRVEGSRVIWTIVIISLSGLFLAVFILLRPATFKIKIKPLPLLLENVLKKCGKKVPQWLSRWSYRAQMSAAEKAYQQLGRSIKFMGYALNPADTPTDRAQFLTRLIPQTRESAAAIIQEYHLDQFSTHIINKERAKEASQHIRRLVVKTRLKQWLFFGDQVQYPPKK